MFTGIESFLKGFHVLLTGGGNLSDERETERPFSESSELYEPSRPQPPEEEVEDEEEQVSPLAPAPYPEIAPEPAAVASKSAVPTGTDAGESAEGDVEGLGDAQGSEETRFSSLFPFILGLPEGEVLGVGCCGEESPTKAFPMRAPVGVHTHKNHETSIF